MPYFPWTEALSLGIASIDAQHRRLVDLANALHDAARAPAGGAEAGLPHTAQQPDRAWQGVDRAGLDAADRALFGPGRTKAASPGPACSAVALVLELQAYADAHFHIEEGYMQAFEYPDFAAHKAEHEIFSTAVRGFADACAGGVADPAKMLDFLKDWLTVHISCVDARLGEFLRPHLR